MNVENLKKKIDALVALTAPESITPAVMGNVLTIIADLLNKAAVTNGMQFAGVATPGTNPGTPDGNVFYIATEKGDYANFGGITLDGEKFAVLTYDGTWKKQEVDTAGAFRSWLAQYTTKPGDTRLVGESGKDVAFEVDAKADKVEIVAPTLNLIAPDDDPYKVTAATLPGATAQAAGVMTSEQVRNLGKALAKVGFAGNINFNDPNFYQDVEMAQGWYTLPEGLYTVEGEAFSGLMLITKSATAHQDDGRNVIIDSEPEFFFVGNAKFVTYDKADTDVTNDVAKGDGFSVYTKMEATNDIQMVEYSTGYAITRFGNIGNTEELVTQMSIIVTKIITTPIVTKVGKVIPTVSDVSFDVTTADMNVGADENVKTNTEKMTIPPATTEKAGVMSAKDKTTLDTLASQGTIYDLFVAAGATPNKDGRTWTMNGITDLTTRELINAYQRRPIGMNIAEAFASVPSDKAFRTHFPIPGWFNPSFDTIDRLCYNNKSIEVVAFGGGAKIGDSYCPVKSMSEAFWSAEKLRIVDKCKIVIGGRADNAFYRCLSLQEIRITGMNADISFSDSPLLSKDSILYMATNARPSKAITITLHPTAYAMATADAEIQAALQAQPLVSLAEGVPSV